MIHGALLLGVCEYNGNQTEMVPPPREYQANGENRQFSKQLWHRTITSGELQGVAGKHNKALNSDLKDQGRASPEI